MHKKTLNIISVCVVALIIVFAVTHKGKLSLSGGDNIVVDENGKILTKADQYQANILETVTEENIKNFKKFSQSFEKSSADNITDGLSKDIFTQYIKFNTSGELTDDDIMTAANDVLKNKGELQNPTTYNDIKIAPSSITNLKVYGNNVARIQNGINAAILGLKKTDKTPYLASIYGTGAKLMLEIEVPDSLSDNHVNMINGLRKYSEGLNMIAQQNSDPARALIGVSWTKDASEEVVSSFDKVVKTLILNKEKLNYNQTDPGYSLIIDNQ